jgi:hypothetical protein
LRKPRFIIKVDNPLDGQHIEELEDALAEFMMKQNCKGKIFSSATGNITVFPYEVCAECGERVQEGYTKTWYHDDGTIEELCDKCAIVIGID